MISFQNHLSQFSSSVTSYAPNASLASDLVVDSDQIHTEIDNLSERLHILETHTLQASSISSKLSNSMETILRELGDAKHELDSLPSTKSELLQDLSTENTSQVLTYGLKLAKFTKLSKSLNGLVHPNNFIWPADDTLRRGGLAMMNSIGEKVIAIENGDVIPPDGQIEVEVKDQKTIQEDKPSFVIPEKRESFSIPTVPKIDPSAALVGLDLDMDSDDE